LVKRSGFMSPHLQPAYQNSSLPRPLSTPPMAFTPQPTAPNPALSAGILTEPPTPYPSETPSPVHLYTQLPHIRTDSEHRFGHFSFDLWLD
jgi:hypothetical protein